MARSSRMETAPWGLVGGGMEIVGVKKDADGKHLRFCLKKQRCVQK